MRRGAKDPDRHTATMVGILWVLGGTVFAMFGTFDGSPAEAVWAGPLAENEMAL